MTDTPRRFGEWVACTDELPVAEVPVLIRANDGTMITAKRAPMNSIYFWDVVGYYGYDLEFSWNENLPFDGVTHWTPLPEQPGL